MTINTEFNVGEDVYYIITHPTFFEGEFINKYFIKSGTIVSIQTNTTETTEILYDVNDPRHIFREKVFASIGAAKEYLYGL